MMYHIYKFNMYLYVPVYNTVCIIYEHSMYAYYTDKILV